LLMASQLDAEQADMIRVIDDSGQILLRLLNDILDLSKIEAGKMDLDTAVFDPCQLAGDTQTLWSARAGEKALDFTIDVQAPEDARYEGDVVRLKQILFNLIGNAIKFTDEGLVDVRIALHAIGRRRSVLRVDVHDTGCGVSEAARADLFTAFTQANSEATRTHGGSGLGLTISKRLVELMGGTIGMRAREPRGSTFWFEVPLRRVLETPVSAEAATAPVRTGTQAGGVRVLVAEDNPINQTVARGFLKLRGLSASFVENGQQAVEAVQAQDFDLVLMDMEMPVMDGLDATRQIRRLPGPSGRTPIIALTANAVHGSAQRCLEAGMNAYVSKPIDQTALFAAIDACLAPSAAAPGSAANDAA
jgi:two-component system, sensor histidine kinase